VDNSIRLKEFLRKEDYRLGILILYFQKGVFLMTRGGQDDFTFFERSFWGGIGRVDFTFWDGDYVKGSFFLGSMGGRSLVVFKGWKVGVFFCFSKKKFFGGVGWGAHFFSSLVFFII
jgi:hypothetical protein